MKYIWFVPCDSPIKINYVVLIRVSDATQNKTLNNLSFEMFTTIDLDSFQSQCSANYAHRKEWAFSQMFREEEDSSDDSSVGFDGNFKFSFYFSRLI